MSHNFQPQYNILKNQTCETVNIWSAEPQVPEPLLRNRGLPHNGSIDFREKSESKLYFNVLPPLTTRQTQTAHRTGGLRCRKT